MKLHDHLHNDYIVHTSIKHSVLRYMQRSPYSQYSDGYVAVYLYLYLLCSSTCNLCICVLNLEPNM